MTQASPQRSLGWLSSSAIVVSSMVGAGVFTTSGFSLADLGSPSRVLAAWAVAGLIALCGAIGYSALARRFVESGGEYLFLSRQLHPSIGFVAGIVSLIAGFTGAIAFAATALEAYVAPPESWPAGVVASAVILFATALHLVHVEAGARVQNAIVAGKFLLLTAFLRIAAAHFPANWPGWTATTEPAAEMTLADFCMSLVWISLSYCGFNAAVYAAGEVRDPERNVPRALMLGTIATTIFYLLLNTVFVWAPELNTVAGQEQVAAIAARTVGGPNLERTMRLIVIVSLFTSVSAMIMTGPRVYAKMADDRLLPGWLRFAGPVPRRALLFQAGLALVVVHVSTLKQLLSYLGFTLSITAALTVSSLLWARHSLPVSLGVRLAAGLYVASTLIIAFLAASRTPMESGLALLTLVGAFGVYWLVKPAST